MRGIVAVSNGYARVNKEDNNINKPLTELGRECWLLRVELTLSELPLRPCEDAGRIVTIGELRKGCPCWSILPSALLTSLDPCCKNPSEEPVGP